MARAVTASLTHINLPFTLEYAPDERYPQGLSATLELTVNFYDEAKIEIDGPTGSLQSWMENFWESVGPAPLRELADFIEWLNTQQYFLDACKRFEDAVEERIVHDWAHDHFLGTHEEKANDKGR